ncbi:hypothetical protein [Streptomyces sp. NPDC093600]|uniref:hypothetical protein n=1 Tax=Streptomyces sp. NPDC093600 TaxID=3366047 RepID=UPI0037F3CF22
MARMRRGLVHALAWSLATGAAVTLSWWGVHSVLAGTAYDPPRALPIPAGSTGTPPAGAGDPLASSTPRPTTPPASPSTEPRTTDRPTKAPAPTPSREPAASRPGPERSPDGGSVKSYAVDGGRVVFDLGPASAELVSATPASGWQMQVWKQPTWIRVTFTRDGRELSVFCVWHDTAPRVEIEDR